MALDKLKCPNCGALVPGSETISHQIAERTREQLKTETLAQQEVIAAKETELTQREAALDRTVQERVEAKHHRLKLEAEATAIAAVSVELKGIRRERVHFASGGIGADGIIAIFQPPKSAFVTANE